MFARSLFARRQVRKFSFTTYYYDHTAEEEEAPEQRIKFRRLGHGVARKKPVRGLALLAILVLFCMYYFFGLVEQDRRNFKIEDIRIEETP